MGIVGYIFWYETVVNGNLGEIKSGLPKSTVKGLLKKFKKCPVVVFSQWSFIFLTLILNTMIERYISVCYPDT